MSAVQPPLTSTLVSGSRRTIVKRIVLDRADCLMIHSGAGTRIRASTGGLWVTEDKERRDHVLEPGQSHVLTRKGTAVVHALQRARLVLEIAPDVEPPRTIELALAADGRCWPIALEVRPEGSLPASTGFAARVKDGLASILGLRRQVTHNGGSRDRMVV